MNTHLLTLRSINILPYLLYTHRYFHAHASHIAETFQRNYRHPDTSPSPEHNKDIFPHLPYFFHIQSPEYHCKIIYINGKNNSTILLFLITTQKLTFWDKFTDGIPQSFGIFSHIIIKNFLNCLLVSCFLSCSPLHHPVCTVTRIVSLKLNQTMSVSLSLTPSDPLYCTQSRANSKFLTMASYQDTAQSSPHPALQPHFLLFFPHPSELRPSRPSIS